MWFPQRHGWSALPRQRPLAGQALGRYGYVYVPRQERRLFQKTTLTACAKCSQLGDNGYAFLLFLFVLSCFICTDNSVMTTFSLGMRVAHHLSMLGLGPFCSIHHFSLFLIVSGDVWFFPPPPTPIHCPLLFFLFLSPTPTLKCEPNPLPLVHSSLVLFHHCRRPFLQMLVFLYNTQTPSELSSWISLKRRSSFGREPWNIQVLSSPKKNKAGRDPGCQSPQPPGTRSPAATPSTYYDTEEPRTGGRWGGHCSLVLMSRKQMFRQQISLQECSDLGRKHFSESFPQGKPLSYLREENIPPSEPGVPL